MVYEGKIVYEQDGCGILSSGDTTLSAENIGEIIIEALENGSTEIDSEDLFDNGSSLNMFKKQKWDQLGTGWKANCYYDC